MDIPLDPTSLREMAHGSDHAAPASAYVLGERAVGRKAFTGLPVAALYELRQNRVGQAMAQIGKRSVHESHLGKRRNLVLAPYGAVVYPIHVQLWSKLPRFVRGIFL